MTYFLRRLTPWAPSKARPALGPSQGTGPAEEDWPSAQTRRAPAPQDPAPSAQPQPHPDGPLHTRPIEQGGISTSELKREMLADALAQEEAIPILCAYLEKIVARNDGERRRTQAAHSHSEPSVTDFVQRIVDRNACSPCAVVVGVMYMERLTAKLPSIRLQSSNAEAMICVAFNLAGKFCDDFGLSNAQWAAGFSGGLSLREFNRLELEVLFALEFELGVGSQEYKNFLARMLLQTTTPPHTPEPAPTPPATRGGKLQSSYETPGTAVRVQCPVVPGRAREAERRAARREWGLLLHQEAVLHEEAVSGGEGAPEPPPAP